MFPKRPTPVQGFDDRLAARWLTDHCQFFLSITLALRAGRQSARMSVSQPDIESLSHCPHLELWSAKDGLRELPDLWLIFKEAFWWREGRGEKEKRG